MLCQQSYDNTALPHCTYTSIFDITLLDQTGGSGSKIKLGISLYCCE